MIVMADYSLDNDSDAVVIGVDAEGVSYILEPDGEFGTSTSDFQVINVRVYC